MSTKFVVFLALLTGWWWLRCMEAPRAAREAAALPPSEAQTDDSTTCCNPADEASASNSDRLELAAGATSAYDPSKRCNPNGICTACTTCTACRHCAIRGNSCSKCR